MGRWILHSPDGGEKLVVTITHHVRVEHQQADGTSRFGASSEHEMQGEAFETASDIVTAARKKGWE